MKCVRNARVFHVVSGMLHTMQYNCYAGHNSTYIFLKYIFSERWDDWDPEFEYGKILWKIFVDLISRWSSIKEKNNNNNSSGPGTGFSYRGNSRGRRVMPLSQTTAESVTAHKFHHCVTRGLITTIVSYNKLSSFSYDARVLTLSLDAIVHSLVVVYTRTAIKNFEIPGKIWIPVVNNQPLIKCLNPFIWLAEFFGRQPVTANGNWGYRERSAATARSAGWHFWS